MSLSQLTLTSIDDMSHKQLEDAVYDAWLSMLPDNVKVYSLQRRIWIDPNDKLSIFLNCSFSPTYLLPRLNTCSGFGTQKREGVFVSALNPCYYSDVFTSTDRSEIHAIYKVWLKAFLSGHVKPTFWHDTHYYAYPPHIEQQIGLLLGSPHRPTFNSSHFNLPSTCIAKSQLQSVTLQFETVTKEESKSTINDVTHLNSQLCPCGCGVTLTGRQKSATPACRKRLERQRKVA